MPMVAALSASEVRALPSLSGDAAAADLQELDWLDAIADGARVVAVGESAHYNAESYRVRHLVLRYLVERHGFTAYAMESGFVESTAVAGWLAGGADPEPGARAVEGAALARVLAHGHTSLMGLFAPQRELLRWLRGTSPRVGFYGVDTPGSNVSLVPALELVAGYLDTHDVGLALDPALRELAGIGAATSVFAAGSAVAEYVALGRQRRDELTAGLSLLWSRLRATATHPGAGPEHGTAERASALAVALDALRRDGTVNVRDLAQADTVEWILQREQRVVFAAHNAHVQRWPSQFPGALPLQTTAGQHLAQRLGPQYRTIGVTTGTGESLASGDGFFRGAFFDPLPAPPPGTLDAVLAATHDAPFALDLRRLGEADRAVLGRVQHLRSGAYLCPIDPLVAFDAVVHLPRVTAAEPDVEAVAAAPPEVRAAFERWTALR